ncbi:hypothetical protein Pmar_PMAR024679 [Perkinsus marinus ATCC 50983]|uniref:Uncharacterized protein n=1 Tax=Perkinsus marinus (strain ATCC 50983 / TXsc) TaxID=423536 RepID=C5M1B8_PERM5|nr:hypothetical protein Pmar_PMAR024679 [Perkinsus marinus ATCC 50983]EEQ97240.1 hypothetical protein Pmar_PMAR024679 [Perkinsus marinus ATCC 50983]|eukprot:XP_002764523.1 hypothetical protein Pmar_PMAR024679 [Perkinsus marinus ATCC 50983]
MLREEVVADRGPEIDFKIRQIASNLHHQADNLVRLLDRDYALGHYARVTPAVQWAQNSTHVFINIKYSHRWNSPVIALQAMCLGWWTQSSVGRMSVTLEKAEGNFRWRQLVFEPKKQISLGSVGPWLDLAERYAEEVSTLPYHDGYQKSKPTQSSKVNPKVYSCVYAQVERRSLGRIGSVGVVLDCVYDGVDNSVEEGELQTVV